MSKAPFLKDIVVPRLKGAKRLIKVIVLSENENGIVYVPLNAIGEVDYLRFKEAYDNATGELIEELRRTTLDNGRNALVTYQDIIAVHNPPKAAPVPEKPAPKADQSESGDESEGNGEFKIPEGMVLENGKLRPRKKPGPRPKNKE